MCLSFLAEFVHVLSGELKSEIRKSLWWRISAANSEQRRKERVRLVRSLKERQAVGQW